MSEKDSVRDQIVDAAKKRFSHFGYAKTTMAEVAGDCRSCRGKVDFSKGFRHSKAQTEQTAGVVVSG